MSSDKQTDHEGRDVPSDEPLDTVIDVWQIDPHMQNSGFDCCVIRSWQEMLEFVSSNLDSHLENFETDQLREGVTINLRLVRMTRWQYDEIQDGSDP